MHRHETCDRRFSYTLLHETSQHIGTCIYENGEEYVFHLILILLVISMLERACHLHFLIIFYVILFKVKNILIARWIWFFRINFTGLGDEWGAAPPPNNPLETSIKELGSHLLQVSKVDYIVHLLYLPFPCLLFSFSLIFEFFVGTQYKGNYIKM